MERKNEQTHTSEERQQSEKWQREALEMLKINDNEANKAIANIESEEKRMTKLLALTYDQIRRGGHGCCHCWCNSSRSFLSLPSGCCHTHVSFLLLQLATVQDSSAIPFVKCGNPPSVLCFSLVGMKASSIFLPVQ